MSYPNTITVGQDRYFDLFDNIQYKYVKEIIHQDEMEDLEVEIKDLPCDRECYGKVSFKFKLRCDICTGSLPIWKTSTFTVELEYNTSSGYALELLELQGHFETEECVDDLEESQE